MKLRDLKANQIPFWYQLYEGEVDVVDKDGNLTGEKISQYSNPVQAYARVSANGQKAGSSAASGEAYSSPFGIDIEYDRAISTVKDLPIREFSRLFIDVVPEIDGDGSTDTEPDYYCVRPALGLNQNVWALKKLKASA